MYSIRLDAILIANISDEDKEFGNKFSCTFYGDVVLKQNPSTFEEAVNVYRTLPDLIRGEKNGEICGVPQVAYLYPLKKLDSKAAVLVRTISNNLVNDCAKLIADYEKIALDAGELLRVDLCQLPGQAEQIQQFKELISHFVSDFRGELCKLLPAIRGGGKGQTALSEEISKVKKSIFAPDLLKLWVDGKMQEAKTVREWLSTLNSIMRAFGPGEIQKNTHADEKVVVLTFGKIASDESDMFLGLLQDSRDGNIIPRADGVDVIYSAWYRDEEGLRNISKRVQLFKDLYDSVVDTKNVKFLLTAGGGRAARQIEAGTTFLYQNGIREQFQPPSRPGVPKLDGDDTRKKDSVPLVWSIPEIGTKCVTGYRVLYRYYGLEEEEPPFMHVDKFDVCKAIVDGLTPETSYSFAVAPVTCVGIGKPGNFSEPIATTAPPSYASQIIEQCPLVTPPSEDGKSPAWYLLPSKEVYDDLKGRHRAFEVNARHPQNAAHRIVMLLGSTGAGKTTLINGLVNYVFGVQNSDNYRLMLIKESTNLSQAHSQTKDITAYTINYHPDLRIKYTLTIIDTPGFGDTAGIQEDNRITSQIREFLHIKGEHAVDQLHAVGFVAQACIPRLTEPQIFIFNSIQSLFGKDIAENIFPLLTFADGKDPQILGALGEHGVPCDHYFKFNNSVFIQQPHDGVDAKGQAQQKTRATKEFDNLFWELAYTSYKEFLEKLAVCRPVSMTLTREVLTERQKLETKITGLEGHIRSGVNHLALMRQELPVIEQLSAEVRFWKLNEVLG